ncbi:CU044_5270 family protein [Streptomyces sp. HD1123-B1]|uniref:CU044_5270 family protein n=1 Tax=Streptomyces huangiella TaxID=3228804 RepID=UPI003D7D75DC
MDEMTKVRELRSQAPRPDAIRLAAGRRQLTEAAEGGARARRLNTPHIRLGWRLAAVGAAATVTAAAVLAAQLVDGGEAVRTAPVAAMSQSYAVALGSPAETLRDAAATAERAKDPRPHDGQWVFTETSRVNATDGERPDLVDHSSWSRYDNPSMEGGKAGDDHSPRETYRFLNSLPEDPAKVRAKARAFYPKADGETRAQHDFRALTLLTDAYPAPPKGRAAVFRAMAAIPGLKADSVKDILGRDAIALSLGDKAQGDLRGQYLYNPRTWVSSGSRHIAVADNPGGEGGPEDHWKAGDVIISEAQESRVLVDDKGDKGR